MEASNKRIYPPCEICNINPGAINLMCYLASFGDFVEADICMECWGKAPGDPEAAAQVMINRVKKAGVPIPLKLEALAMFLKRTVVGKVVHCKKSPYDVYIGRPGKWGNPYSHKPGTQAKFLVASREEAIAAYEEYLLNSPELMAALPELKGKVLGCWCKPLSCHGDILLKHIP